MTGYQSKKAAAQEKLEQAKEILLQYPQKDIDWQREQQIKAHTKLNDDDTQVYKDHGVALHSIKHPPGLMDEMALTIAYQSGYYDGKKAAQPAQEPVAWGVFEGNLHDMFFTEVEAVEMAHLKGSHAEVRPLYTAPPQEKNNGT